MILRSVVAVTVNRKKKKKDYSVESSAVTPLLKMEARCELLFILS